MCVCVCVCVCVYARDLYTHVKDIYMLYIEDVYLWIYLILLSS